MDTLRDRNGKEVEKKKTILKERTPETSPSEKAFESIRELITASNKSKKLIEELPKPMQTSVIEIATDIVRLSYDLGTALAESVIEGDEW